MKIYLGWNCVGVVSNKYGCSVYFYILYLFGFIVCFFVYIQIFEAVTLSLFSKVLCRQCRFLNAPFCPFFCVLRFLKPVRRQCRFWNNAHDHLSSCIMNTALASLFASTAFMHHASIRVECLFLDFVFIWFYYVILCIYFDFWLILKLLLKW